MPILNSPSLLLTLILLAVLAWISLVDVRHGIIPDWANAAIAGAGFFRAWLQIGPSIPEAALAALFALCAFSFLRSIFVRCRGYPGMGLGDVKFLAAAATWTGFIGLPTLILIASVSGLLLVIVRSLFGYSTPQTARLPFGPHLAAALAIVCFGGSVN
jgi:leader peptidase (prepilin peptidase)/N-methyltransferase